LRTLAFALLSGHPVADLDQLFEGVPRELTGVGVADDAVG